jgi:TetR/AcrR family transcriptional repressor of nem operon
VAPADVDTLTAKGRATRGRIVAAAAESMMARGVERTTIQDVMAAAAVSGSQMYHYFANKADLVAAVIDFATDGVLSVQQMGLDRIESVTTCTSGATSWWRCCGTWVVPAAAR